MRRLECEIGKVREHVGAHVREDDAFAVEKDRARVRLDEVLILPSFPSKLAREVSL